MNTTETRPLYQIARDIRKDWKPIHPWAIVYVQAMETMNSIKDNYIFDSGMEIVCKFLGNASTWRGSKAKEIKAELKKMAGIK